MYLTHYIIKRSKIQFCICHQIWCLVEPERSNSVLQVMTGIFHLHVIIYFHYNPHVGTQNFPVSLQKKVLSQSSKSYTIDMTSLSVYNLFGQGACSYLETRGSQKESNLGNTLSVEEFRCNIHEWQSLRRATVVDRSILLVKQNSSTNHSTSPLFYCTPQLSQVEHNRLGLMLCPSSWWRHQMEIFSALLVLCVGNSPVTGEFPSQRPVTRSFCAFVDLRLNKRLSKQSRRWWVETPLHPLWRHCNVEIIH